jgi:hypothetical protein
MQSGTINPDDFMAARSLDELIAVQRRAIEKPED